MGDVSEASLLDYIHSSGGKVKNADLLKTFKQFVNHNDLLLRAKYREDFKDIIDRIAVCKTENGEKYLILKKKYKQLMQERESEPAVSGQGVKRKTNQVEWCVGPTITVTDARDRDRDESKDSGILKRNTNQVEWCVGPTITVTDAQEPDESEDVTVDYHSVEKPEPLLEENPEPTDTEDDLDKDSGSKSESEQEEESTGSVGSANVALDPIEKEWIYSAACGRLSHLTQLLKQDASLANKKDFTSTALHWAAKHGKEDMAVAMAKAGADVNTKAGGYTPLHIAALHRHMHIFNLLVQTYGAKENVRDYSGHLASHYLNLQKAEESTDPNAGYHSPAQVTERRNRKLTSLFQSRKKWGSAEELAPVPEERSVPHQLVVPAFRPRKFSR